MLTSATVDLDLLLGLWIILETSTKVLPLRLIVEVNLKFRCLEQALLLISLAFDGVTSISVRNQRPILINWLIISIL